MTPAALDDLCRTARRAWDAVPTYLRQAKTGQRWGSTDIRFSDRRGT